MASARSLHIACNTWDQVEAIYERKLRRGNLMSIKVPFDAAPGDRITLGLELPSQLVIAIDGAITKTAAVDGTDKRWIEIELVGLTSDLIARLRGLVRDARVGDAPPVPPPRTQTAELARGLPSDERRLFLHLSAELRRLRALPVHGVLGVDGNAGAGSLRRNWLELVHRFHPDVVAPRRSAAVSHLAEEIVIHLNRAYDRCRELLRSQGGVVVRGASMLTPGGWLVGNAGSRSVDAVAALGPELERRRSANVSELAPIAAPVFADDELEPEVTVARVPTPVTPSRAADIAPQVRALLADGKAQQAREELAGALCVFPRSRTLRGLYHVTSAVIAIAHAQPMLAVAQLEAALTIQDEGGHAAALLELVQAGPVDSDAVREIFR